MKHKFKLGVVLFVAVLVLQMPVAFAHTHLGDELTGQSTETVMSIDFEYANDFEFENLSALKTDPGAYIVESEDGHTYILIAVGQKNTAGYNVGVTSASLAGERLILDIVVQRATGFVAQVISYPYAIVKVEEAVSEVDLNVVGVNTKKHIPTDSDNVITEEVSFTEIELSHEDPLLDEIMELRQVRGCYKLESMKEGTVVLVAAGQKPTAGWELEVEEVRLERRKLYVTVEEEKPEGMAAEVLTYPYQIIRVNTSFEAAEFWPLGEEKELDTELKYEFLGRYSDIYQEALNYQELPGAHVVTATDEYTIVVFALGERNNAGYSIRVEELSFEDGILNAEVEELFHDGIVGQVITYPISIVKIYENGIEQVQMEVDEYEIEKEEEKEEDGASVGFEVIDSASYSDIITEYGKTQGYHVIDNSPDDQLILIALGERPTTGYDIKINNVSITAEGTLIISANERRPNPKDMVLTVISSPHKLIKVNRPFNKVELVGNIGRGRIGNPEDSSKERPIIENPFDKLKGRFDKAELDMQIEALFKSKNQERAIDIAKEALFNNPRNKGLYKKMGEVMRKAEKAGAKISKLPVFANGRQVEFDVEPTMVSNRTIVPIRHISEALGAKVGWNNKNRRVTIKKGAKLVEFTVGAQEAFVDGKKIALDVSSQLVDKRTMVPLRFVSEALGANVTWDPEYQTITILE